MSLIVFLAPLAIGTAVTGLCFAKEELSKEDIDKFTSNDSIVYSTNITDERLLRQASTEYGIKLNDDGTLSTLADKGSIVFLKTDNGTYDLVFNGSFTNDDVTSLSEELVEYYNALVQQENYNNVLENLKSKGYELEHEKVMDDESIVLTVNI